CEPLPSSLARRQKTCLLARSSRTAARQPGSVRRARDSRRSQLGLAGIEAWRKDGDVYVVLVVGRIAAAISHVAPALAIARDVPDVLVPDHVVDPERLRIRLGPRSDFVAKRLTG